MGIRDYTSMTRKNEPRELNHPVKIARLKAFTAGQGETLEEHYMKILRQITKEKSEIRRC